MKRLSLALLMGVVCSQAFGQAARFDSVAQTTTTVSATNTTVLVPLSGATITVYAYGTTTKSSVCPDYTLVGCSSSSPNNPITADSLGNFGFWIAPGAYDYTVLPTSGTVQGPYHVFLPMGVTPPSTISFSGVIIPAASGGTGVNNTATSGRYLKGNGTGFATSTGSASGTGSLSCTNQVPTSVTLNSDAAPSGFGCTTLTSAYVNTSIAQTGVDINTSHQVTATHLAAALPVVQGGTGVTTSTGSGANVLGTSPTIATPNISSPTISGNTSMASATMSGTVTSYNGASTVDHGLPADVALVDLTAQTAAITTTTLFAVATAGQYLLEWNAKVTTAAGTSSTLGPLTIVYTDPDGVAQTLTAGAFVTGGAVSTTSTANTTSAVLLGVPILLNCKAGTNITYAMAYASNAANAMNYNLHIRLLAH